MQRINKRRASVRRVVRSGQSQVAAPFGTAKNGLLLSILRPLLLLSFTIIVSIFPNIIAMKLILSEWTESADHIMVINDYEGVQLCLWC